ncbi:hypothetical protein HDU86_000793 [Geranomyces michiganensis]|nr:hypothetical protein HDU86_000793 [Geranomyces michiganensis]
MLIPTTQRPQPPQPPSRSIRAMPLSMLSKHHNQGTSFPQDARTSLGLRGLVPPAHETLDQQVARVITMLNTLHTPIEKYQYLTRLKSEDVVLFYRCVMDNLTQIMPIIYTPVVGEACQKFSLIYTPGLVEGLFLSKDDVDVLPQVLGNWPYPQPDICVITDGSRILGLGDLGVNGMGIPIGKLSLYVAAAGFDPARTLPITLDLGTNNEKFIDDPLYLGARHKRPEDPEFFAYLDKLMKALKEKWPKMLVQFEDFSSDHAFASLDRYRREYLMFNDDIQGTGAVVLAGWINAVRLSGVPLKEHKIVFFGAGSAGVGVAKSIKDHLVRSGMAEEEARNMFWLADSKGLVTLDRGDKLASHKTLFARSDNEGKQYGTLEDVLDYVKPTCLIGLAGMGGAFRPAAIRKMAEYSQHPVIFPLSNPLTHAECTFEAAMEHTNGRVLFGSGTAFPAMQDPRTNKVVEPGQANNCYIFPGLGFGTSLAGATRVSDCMVHVAAVTLAESLTPEEHADRRLYPRLERIRQVSARIARDVAVQAVKKGIARDAEVLAIFGVRSGDKPDADVLEDPHRLDRLFELVQSRMWEPVYATDAADATAAAQPIKASM